MTEEHIKRWGWRVTENRWVNYPDYRPEFSEIIKT